MTRRDLLSLAAVAPLAASNSMPPPPRLGIDIFSLRSQKLSPIEYLDYCAARHVQVVHFSEIRFLGSLDEANLKQVREHAQKLGLEVEIGMKSICPTSKMFDPKAGTAEEQLSRMIVAASTVGSKIVRAVLGSVEDRVPGPIERHIEQTVQVLRSVRTKAAEHNVKIAIENHAGDMQARELKMLVEEAGSDYVGVCLDAGNPLWTLEDPHLTLETLSPYVLTSHMRDTAVWRVPEGIAVTWVRMGEGNVNIDDYLRKYVRLCPGKVVSLESIVFGPKIFRIHDADFWDPYRTALAWQVERYLEIADKGKPHREEAWDRPNGAQLEREDLDASLDHTRTVFRFWRS